MTINWIIRIFVWTERPTEKEIQTTDLLLILKILINDRKFGDTVEGPF